MYHTLCISLRMTFPCLLTYMDLHQCVESINIFVTSLVQ
jgi:hypothetical protein